METLALYFIKVHVAVSLLYAVYYFLIRKEGFITLNRFVLLAIILVSFSAPLLPGSGMDSVIQAPEATRSENSVFSANDRENAQGLEIAKLDDEIPVKRLSGLITSVLMFYLCFTGFFLVRFLSQLWNVYAVVNSCKRVFDHNTWYLDPGEDIAPFSFFKSIVIHKNQHTNTQLEPIIAHESAHALQWHSIDILMAELTSVLLWGNPVIKSLKNTVRLNLEFLADREVLKQGFDKKQYQWSILMPYLKQNAYPLTNQYSSKPKLRIERMNAAGSSVFNLYKYVFIIPVSMFIYAIVAPFHAAALDKIKTMKLIDNHEYRDYLGYYEFERDKGSYIRIMMKNETLIMKTMWNNQRIAFRKNAMNSFVNPETGIPLQFPRNYEGGVTGLVAFGEDRWKKVYTYKPISKKAGEGTIISRSPSGGMQVLVYATEPWARVSHYNLKKAVASP